MLILGVGLAAVVGFVLSGVYYAVTPTVPVYPGHIAPARTGVQVALVELLRNSAIAALVAGLMAAGRVDGPLQGALLGLALAILPIVLLAGAAFHEGTSSRGAAMHTGDWIIKLVAIGVIVGRFP